MTTRVKRTESSPHKPAPERSPEKTRRALEVPWTTVYRTPDMALTCAPCSC